MFLGVKESRYGTLYSMWACEHCGKKYAYLEASDGRTAVNLMWVTYALHEKEHCGKVK